MTYSIAWGLFSLGLLGIGFWRGSKHARYGSVVLLVITLIKLFLHDLATIQNVFRIGPLVGVAVNLTENTSQYRHIVYGGLTFKF